MTVTRREAVRLGAASAATAAVAAGLVSGADPALAGTGGTTSRRAGAPSPGAAAARAGDGSGDSGAYRLAFWRSLVGSRVTLADRSGSFLVVRVQDLTTSRAAAAAVPGLAPSPRRQARPPVRTGEAFAVRLRGEGPGLPADRVIRLFHPAVGRFDLHIISADPASHDYVAVVNRRLPVG